MATGPVDLELGGQREGDAEAFVCEGTYLLMGTGFLSAELIAGDANDGEIVGGCMQPLQSIILACEATCTGDIHHQHPTSIC